MNRNAQALFRALEARKPVKGETKLVHLVDTLEWTIYLDPKSFRKGLARWSSADRRRLLELVNSRRLRIGAPEIHSVTSGTLKNDLISITHSYALRIAQSLCDELPAKKRRTLVARWVKSPAFRKLSSETLFADEAVDRILGLNEREIKRKLGDKSVTLPRHYLWEDVSLDRTPEDLFTPYRVLMDLFKKLKPKAGDTFVDLGSGLGRVGIALALFYPHVNFIGLELVDERVIQSRRISAKLGLEGRVKFESQDLSSDLSPIPFADHYFLFNPFTLRTLRKTFKRLRGLSERRHFDVTLIRVGRPPTLVKREPWLKPVYHSPDYKNWEGYGWGLYRTRFKPKKG